MIEIESSEVLSGRNAFITGGSSGIGFAIAKAFLKAGASITIAARNETKLLEKHNELLAFKKSNKLCGSVSYYVTDVATIVDASNFFEIVENYLKTRFDILVNNAGIHGNPCPITDSAEFDRIICTNLRAPYILSVSFCKHLLAHNMARGGMGNILNISSMTASAPGFNAYSISKSGVNSFTKGLAQIYTKHGITINAIAPGMSATPMQGNNLQSYLKHNQIKRWILPEEIANLAVFMCSPMGKAMVGSVVDIDGGQFSIGMGIEQFIPNY